MKSFILLFLLLLSALTSSGQKYMTKEGFINFFSHTPLEDIKADNNQVAGALDATTGEMVFQVLIKSFHFGKALMQEHFNENYMESEKYPRSSFRGKITNLHALDFKKIGTYEILVEGDLTIRDVTKKVFVKGILVVAENNLNAEAKFLINPEEYNIKIPAVVRDNIAKTIEVTVKMNYAPIKI